MSRHQKALKRLLSKPTDFEWSELTTVMNAFGYELKTGSGSGRKFVRDSAMFGIHEPHPQSVLKAYQVKGVIDFLRREGDI